LPNRSDKEENNVIGVQLMVQCCQHMLMEVTWIVTGDSVNLASKLL